MRFYIEIISSHAVCNLIVHIFEGMYVRACVLVLWIGTLERWCVCRGDQLIKINVVIKVGGGSIHSRSP